MVNAASGGTKDMKKRRLIPFAVLAAAAGAGAAVGRKLKTAATLTTRWERAFSPP